MLGGHSLGGSVVTAYATWDFAGKRRAPTASSGLVYDRRRQQPDAVSKEQAEEALAKLRQRHARGSRSAASARRSSGCSPRSARWASCRRPNEASLAEDFPLLPSNLKPTNEKGELIPVTNEAEFGFGVNVGTSPPNLIAAQVHAGTGVSEPANEDGLHTAGTATARSRRCTATRKCSPGTGLNSADGDEWYFPERLTIDTGAVADGNANPAQEVLGEHAIHGHELPTSLKILAISSELDKVFGGGSVLTAAEILAEQSGIPAENLTLIDKETEYAHNDPAAAEPGGNIEGNAFYAALVPYLEGIAP